MASTRKLNDPCYFNLLCGDSKYAGNYNLNTDSSINNNKCYPLEGPSNLKKNYKNINIENNLFNIATKDSNCIIGNTLQDKKNQVKNEPVDANCGSSIHTKYNKLDLIANRGIAYKNNIFPINNHYYGSNLDYFNDGKYGYNQCQGSNTDNCFVGRYMQRINGIDTKLDAKMKYRNKLNNLSNCNNSNNSSSNNSSMYNNSAPNLNTSSMFDNTSSMFNNSFQNNNLNNSNSCNC